MSEKDLNGIPELPDFGKDDDSLKKETEAIFSAASRYPYPQKRLEKNWVRFSAQAGMPVPMRVKKNTRFAMFRWAAAAVVVLTATLAVWQEVNIRRNTYTATYEAGNSMQSPQLPDGTQLTLREGAKLSVQAINKRERTLALESGSVRFKVAHGSTPFRLNTPKGIIVVTGTDFIVNCEENRPFTVCLLEGSIRFETTGVETTLTPGQMLGEEKNGDLVISNMTNNICYAWTDNMLRFEEATLTEIIRGLEELYRVSFSYDTALSDKKLTITFDNLKVNQAAELLSKTLGSPVSIR